MRKTFLEMDGLSAQKTVQLCTVFCAYGNLGTKIKDRKAEEQEVGDQRSEGGEETKKVEKYLLFYM